MPIKEVNQHSGNLPDTSSFVKHENPTKRSPLIHLPYPLRNVLIRGTVALGMAFAYGAPLASAASADGCTFQKGFSDLHQLAPDIVGDCTDNEVTDPQTGETTQHTTKGLLDRNPDTNWLGFTDGTNTWVFGPQMGMEGRY